MLSLVVLHALSSLNLLSNGTCNGTAAFHLAMNSATAPLLHNCHCSVPPTFHGGAFCGCDVDEATSESEHITGLCCATTAANEEVYIREDGHGTDCSGSLSNTTQLTLGREAAVTTRSQTQLEMSMQSILNGVLAVFLPTINQAIFDSVGNPLRIDETRDGSDNVCVIPGVFTSCSCRLVYSYAVTIQEVSNLNSLALTGLQASALDVTELLPTMKAEFSGQASTNVGVMGVSGRASVSGGACGISGGVSGAVTATLSAGAKTTFSGTAEQCKEAATCANGATFRMTSTALQVMGTQISNIDISVNWGVFSFIGNTLFNAIADLVLFFYSDLEQDLFKALRPVLESKLQNEANAMIEDVCYPIDILGSNPESDCNGDTNGGGSGGLFSILESLCR
mmetsp:Transcript_21216/g.58213  ORF Transcript_21216/g.58213 Transcript_21216/m.58213 type:complete len:395 (-) Transcript_21216:586-1770(-)